MVISGIIQTIKTDLNTAKVVVLATGTKVIEADVMYEDGTVLMDGHAEIVARRALLHYFYDQIEMCLKPGKNLVDANSEILRIFT